jgi:hypothetical protein
VKGSDLHATLKKNYHLNSVKRNDSGSNPSLNLDSSKIARCEWKFTSGAPGEKPAPLTVKQREDFSEIWHQRIYDRSSANIK